MKNTYGVRNNSLMRDNMPIDKDGNIYIQEKNNKIDSKVVGLIITNIVAIIGCIVAIGGLRLQKLEYEKNVEELELEKTKYENMLKESDIQLRDSYIVCSMPDVKILFDSLGNNVKIYNNEITSKFYNDKTHEYFDQFDLMEDDEQIRNRYRTVFPEVVFSRIDAISNRIINDVCVVFKKVVSTSDFEERLKTFDEFACKYGNIGETITINIGDITPEESILIPVALKYSEADYDYYDNIEEMPYDSIYKIIYIPGNISCYDAYKEEILNFEIRDLLEGSLITSFYFEEQG